ncbi:hypothetical protein F2Q69_00007990 [Brassica cretica]|uniref:Uncharacterized protein n=1 Tax=Brassica cretica TaxID=69181 RepID=A0A8S9PBN0_BRACR|nr:hypothetical protein F2Q69_00007990 [Brassica cretica]
MGSSENRKPSFLMNVLFFCSLYLVAIAQGGHKPCVQAFGADQFDSDHPKERLARGSFFNWWFLFLSGGIAISILVMVYIQSNVNWAFGFGIPCLFMVMALAIFFLGRKTYRYPKRTHEKNNNGFVRIGRVFFGAIKNRKLMNLNKAMLLGEEGVEPCSNMDAKGLVRLIPIWITSMVSMIPYAQYSTLFTKQGVTVDRRILPGLEIPPATLLSFVSISVLISVPIYEHVFLPIARKITKKPNGITMLQRIGTGMMLTCVNMVLAALVEAKRLRIAEEHGLIDKPNVTIPMSIWWFVPQYILVGMIEVFGLVGAQEFFYDQVPTELRSIGLAFSLSALGLSNFLSGLLIIVVDWATERDGGHSWFNNNLNRAHIDYFYWLLAASTAIAFFVFVFISRSKITKKPNGITMLQRIGTGMMLTCVNMVLAALVEAKRLRIAEEHGLIDKPNVTIPMSIWWFVPQYILVGMIEVFGLVGAQEFFYDQVPTELRSIGLAFSLSALGLSNFLSGLLIIVVDWATERDGGHSWFNNNLNRAHIDYFYWLLAASTAIAFFVFVFISRSYVYRRVDQV